MKKVNLKNVLSTLLVVLIFLLVGIGHSEAQAQSAAVNAGVNTSGSTGSSPKSLTMLPSGNFVSAANALVILENHNALMKDQFAFLIPGTATFNALEKEYLFYTTIYDQVLKGTTTPQAIMNSLAIFGADVYPTVTDAIKLSWKQSAVNLLKA